MTNDSNVIDVIKQDIENDNVVSVGEPVSEVLKIDVTNEQKRYVAGWASVEIVDKDGDLIPISVLKSAMLRYVERGGDVHIGHSNLKVGKIVQWQIMKHPDTGKWGVYIIASVFDSYKIDDLTWQAIKEGKIKAFSIGGKGVPTTVVKTDDNGKPMTLRSYETVEISEISFVESPRNPLAYIDEYSKVAKGIVEIDYADVLKAFDINEDDFNKGLSEVDGEIIKAFKEKVDSVINSDVGNDIKVDAIINVFKAFEVVVSLVDKKEKEEEIKKDDSGVDLPEIQIDNRKDAIDAVYDAIGEVRKDEIGLKEKVQELLDLIKAEVSKEKYMEGGHFKEMSCPDNPDSKSRFCGCVRYMMATGKSLESAKKICAYIKRYVKKGDDIKFVVDVFGDEVEMCVGELEAYVEEVEKAKEVIKGKFVKVDKD